MLGWLLNAVLLVSVIHSTLASEHRCGEIKIKKSETLITGSGAVDSYPGQWPWLVPVYWNNSYVCGSSLISEQHLLSAAHCFIYGPEEYHAVLGKFDLKNDTEPGTIVRKLSHAFVHPSYDKSASGYKSNGDIAVLRMQQKVQFSDRIQPVCLPQPDEDSSGLTGTVVGYGYHDKNTHENRPKQLKMTSINSSACIFIDFTYSQTVSGQSFCAKGEDAAPCRGDSGGGYFVIDRTTGRYSTYGIVSHAARFDCLFNDYTIFVDVPKFVEWINEKIRQPLEVEETSTLAQAICYDDDSCVPYEKCSPSLRTCIDPCEEHPCAESAVCVPAVGHTFKCRCPKGLVSDGRNGCTLASISTNLIDGEVENRKCESWHQDLGVCREDEVLQTFKAAKGTAINADDFEVAPKHKSNIVKQFYMNGELGSVSAKFLPIDLHLAFPNLLAIEAKYLKIEKITRKNLEKLPKLRLLNLADNRISSIEKNSLTDLRDLQFLSLFHNKLTRIDSNMLRGLRQLKELRIARNQISEMAEDSFADLSQLKVLGININRLRAVGERTFAPLTSLERIYLNDNQLTTLPDQVFESNLKLKYIWLWGNQITKLSFRLFENKPQLANVDLEKNNCIDKYYSSSADDAPRLTREKLDELKSDLQRNCTA